MRETGIERFDALSLRIVTAYRAGTYDKGIWDAVGAAYQAGRESMRED